MATLRYFWHGFIQGYNIYVPYLSNFCQMFGRRRTPSVRPSLYWPPYSTDKFISCVVPGPSQWFFHFGEEIIITWTHIGWVRWMFQNLPLPAAQEIRDSSGMIPRVTMKNYEVLYHKITAVGQAVACASLTQRARVRSPVGTGFLGEVFSGVFPHL